MGQAGYGAVYGAGYGAGRLCFRPCVGHAMGQSMGQSMGQAGCASGRVWGRLWGRLWGRQAVLQAVCGAAPPARHLLPPIGDAEAVRPHSGGAVGDAVGPIAVIPNLHRLRSACGEQPRQKGALWGAVGSVGHYGALWGAMGHYGAMWGQRSAVVHYRTPP